MKTVVIRHDWRWCLPGVSVYRALVFTRRLVLVSVPT
jgi:hypothetical protein